MKDIAYFQDLIAYLTITWYSFYEYTVHRRRVTREFIGTAAWISLANSDYPGAIVGEPMMTSLPFEAVALCCDAPTRRHQSMRWSDRVPASDLISDPCTHGGLGDECRW